jgi:hypothetical protein
MLQVKPESCLNIYKTERKGFEMMNEKLNVIVPNGNIIEYTLLEMKLNQKVKENFNLYITVVAKWLAMVILSDKPKYVVVHDYDPSWDFSGSLEHKGHLNLRDYNILEDFLDEYTGATLPSYVSGCGLFHQRYVENLEEITRFWLSDQLDLVVQEIFPHLTKEIVEDIIEEIYSADLLGDLLIELEVGLIDRTAKIDVNYLYKLGKEKATHQLKLKHMENLKRQEEEDKQRKIAEQLWTKVKAMYELRYSNTIPNYIDKPLYQEKVQSILVELVHDGIPLEHIRYLGRFRVHSFSNSVTDNIISFQTRR